jgi:hypothetical protein
MDEAGAVGFLVVGIAVAAYGIRGIVNRRITVFSKGRVPTLAEGSEAVSHGIIVTTFGLGFALFGALLLFVSVHA